MIDPTTAIRRRDLLAGGVGLTSLAALPALPAWAQGHGLSAHTGPRAELTGPDITLTIARQHMMIDGKPYNTLRRHLATNGLTPEQYRERYNLKADYPMVSETYSESRRAMAKKIGLGRKPGTKMASAAKPKGVKAAKSAAAAHLSGE